MDMARASSSLGAVTISVAVVRSLRITCRTQSLYVSFAVRSCLSFSEGGCMMTEYGRNCLPLGWHLRNYSGGLFLCIGSKFAIRQRFDGDSHSDSKPAIQSSSAPMNAWGIPSPPPPRLHFDALMPEASKAIRLRFDLDHILKLCKRLQSQGFAIQSLAIRLRFATCHSDWMADGPCDSPFARMRFAIASH